VAQRFVKEGAFVYLTGRRQNDLDMAAVLIGDGFAPVPLQTILWVIGRLRRGPSTPLGLR